MPKEKIVRRRPKEEESISAITVGCFKSIREEQRIEIRPLTLLAGANSSGKSSIMQPVLMLKQTLEAGYDPGALLLDGPNVKFTSTEQFLCGAGAKRKDSFSVGIELTTGSKIDFNFKKEPKKAIFVESVKYSENGKSFSLNFGMTYKDFEKELEETHALLKKNYFPKIKPLSTFLSDAKLKIANDRCFLAIEYLSKKFSPELNWIINQINQEFRRYVSPIRGVIHLPGLRGNPQRDYPKADSGPSFPGVFTDYVAGIVLEWKVKKDKRLKELGDLLLKLGLTWKIDAGPVKDTRVEIKVGRMPVGAQGGARDLVSIADVGFGVSQTLPVLVALLVAEPGHTVYLEQPEIHLHPRAQVALADILADAAKRGVKVIAETHSALLLLRIQTLVAKGDLSPDLVKLHWFDRNEEDGFTEIKSADLDEKGAYSENWPENFGKVMLDAEKDYLDAVDEL